MPRVATALSLRDKIGTVGTRTGFTRNNYRITPGLYCTGSPSGDSVVVVTANYKLSFDALRKELGGINSWILVLDTRGINVWCAAGKGSFSAEEIGYQVQRAQLGKIVNHRELTLPQLCANGVALSKLKKLCGFSGKFGPIKASMIPDYLECGKADEAMRTITFSLRERAVLIPLEICMLWRHVAIACLIFVLISGITREGYSLGLAVERTVPLLLGTLLAVISGALATPLLLPWLVFRQFWLKGALLGLVFGGCYLFLWPLGLSWLENSAILLWMAGCSSYLAMNFTGSTVFTSLSGVKKELGRGLVMQITAVALSLVCWIGGGLLT